jgi:DNA-binding NarL/FixJ family response regulator
MPMQRFQQLSLELRFQIERLSSISAGIVAEVHPLPDSLERILSIPTRDPSAALTQAANIIAETLKCEKVDVFVHDRDTDSLVALGTSTTPLGKLQHDLGLDRLPLKQGGRVVRAFRSGTADVVGNLENDPEERPEILEQLGVRSAIMVPLTSARGERAVLAAASTRPHRFDEREMRFLAAAAQWVGMLADRLDARKGIATGGSATRTARATEAGRLTPRQREIALLVARGFSNAEIARELILTPGTVANHIAQMLQRLNFTSRTQIGVWAVRNLAEGFDPVESENGRHPR